MRILWTAAAVAGASLLFVISERLSATAPITADSANAVLQGQAIADGNLLLHGWTLSKASFLATDLPFYALLAWWRGVSPSVAHDAAAAIYTLLVLAACLLARGHAQGRDVIQRMAIPLVLLVAPAPGVAAQLILLGPFHVGTTLLLVLAFVVVDHLPAGRSFPGTALLCALLTLAVLSDALAILLGVVPLVAVSGSRLWSRRLPRWPDVGVLLAAVAALPAAVMIALALQGAGGFSTTPLQAGFVRLEDVPANLALTAEGTLAVFGADLFDKPVNLATLATLATLVRLAGLALVAVTWWRTIAAWRAGARMGIATQALAVAMFLDLASYLLGNVAIDLRTSRYLVPLLVFGAVLAGRCGAGWLWRGRLRGPALVVALGYVALLGLSLRAPVAVNQEAAVGDFLQQRGLTYGLSGYWEASPVTLATDGRVQVRAIVVIGRTASPYLWEAANGWYDASAPGHDARFVLRDTCGPEPLDRQATESAFGRPAREYRVGRYEVLVWDRNLLNDLNLPKPRVFTAF